MQPITEKARAKVNLTLRVRGRRADGYHELESLVAFAEIGDTLTFTPGRERSVTVAGPFADKIVGPDILDRCLDLVTEVAGAYLQLGAVALQKELPVAAGIGGGSSNAAALLRAIARANPETAGNVAWAKLAAKLGADVPVCLENRASIMSGIGDVITPVTLPKLPTVLVNPRVPVPADKTAQVFRRLRAGPVSAAANPSHILPPFEDQSQLVAYLAAHDNDLGPSARAVIPAIEDVENALGATAGCLLVRISGAGPTCFGVYDCEAAAAEAATHLMQSHPTWWVMQAEVG